MRIFLYILFLSLGLSLPSKSQQILEAIQIERDDGLRDREVFKIIRDSSGYFHLIMENHIQIYNGKTFNDINLSVIPDKAFNLQRDIYSYGCPKDGIPTFTLLQDSAFYRINRLSAQLSRIPVDGTPIVSNRALYFVHSDDERYSIRKLLKSGKDSIIHSFNYNNTLEPRDIAFIGDKTYIRNDKDEVFCLDKSHLFLLKHRGKIATFDDNLLIFDSNHIIRYETTNHTIDTLKSIMTDDVSLSIRNTVHDKNGNLILAYSASNWYRDSVFVLNKSTYQFENYNIVSSFNDKFQDIYVDDYNYQWIIVGHNGMHVLRFNRNGSKIYYRAKNTPKGEFGHLISALIEDKNGNIYSARESKNFHVLNPSKGTFDLFPEHILKYFYENQLMDYNSEGHFICSYSYNLKTKKGRYKKLFLNNNTLRNYEIPLHIKDIFIRDQHRVILSGYDFESKKGYILSHDDRTNQVDTILEHPESLIHMTKPTSTGHRIITTATDALLVNKDFKIENSFKAVNKQSTLNSPRSQIIYKDKVILGSFNGIYILDYPSLKLEKHFSELNGLTNSKIMAILEDGNENIWITSYNGITILDCNFNIIKRLYENDGLANREFNTKAAILASDGLIYFGTINGIQALDPEKVLQWKPLYGLDLKHLEGYTGESHIDLVKEKVIKVYDTMDSIVIRFATPDYYAYPNQLKLIDVKGDCVDAILCEDSKTITLKNFSNSTFSLLINSHTGEKKQIYFNTVRDYKSLWNILKYVLLISACIILIASYIIKNNKKYQEEKTRFNTRIAELQMTALQSQMNPHFIFNSLGAIQYFIQTHDTEKADEYLSNFAKLMRMILESSKSNTVRVIEEIELLKLYITMVDIRFEGKFETIWNIDENLYEDDKIAPMIVQPFIENAINHGLTHLTERKGKLTVNVLCPEEDCIVFEVIDNGVGRTRAAQLRSSNHIPRSMQIVNERIELSSTSQNKNVHTEIIDLYDTNNNPIGTKAVITFTLDFKN